MKFFELIYNAESVLSIIVFTLMIFFSIYLYRHTQDAQEKHQLIISMGVELLVIILLLYGLKSFSSTTKSVVGFVDVLGWFL